MKPATVNHARPVANGESSPRPLHRVRDVRKSEGISLRVISRRLRQGIERLRSQEDPHTDLKLSSLYLWQAALRVPVKELLVEPTQGLSEPVRQRACLLRVAKTVLSLHESSPDEPTKRLAEMMYQQLLDVMPELEEVAAWPEFGARRAPNELGRTAMEPVADRSLFGDDKRHD